MPLAQRLLIVLALFISFGATAEDEPSFERAQALWKSGQEQEALKMFHTLSEKGDIHAQNTLGTYYYVGLKVTKDSKKAQELWQLACDGGLWQSCTNVGLLFMEAHQFNEAERLFMHNAQHYKDRGAMRNLVKLYRTSTWSGKSEKKAKHWELELDK
mgnify:CR=1 FL=1